MAEPPGHWVDLGAARDLASPELQEVEVEGSPVVVVATAGGFSAFQGLCSHELYPLADGFVHGGRLTCALHGSTFDLATGDVTLGPADQPIARYEVDVADGRVRLFVPADGLARNQTES